MRGLPIVAVLLVGALLLSGCSSKGDGTTTSSPTTSGTRTGGTGTRTTTNTTTAPAPNIPPIVVLKVSNATGAATNVTFVGGSLTFDASGSRDPDGDGLSAIAISAQDSNQTYKAGVLYSAGAFRTVTYKFDRPGIVNVTVSGIDVRGNLTTLAAKVYVNERINVTSQMIAVPSADGVPSAPTDCTGPGSTQGIPSGSVLDSSSFDRQPFNVAKGVQSIVATWVSGDGAFAICGPDGKAASGVGDSATPAQTTGALASPKGTESYTIGFTANTPQAKVMVQVVVHYEPKAAK